MGSTGDKIKGHANEALGKARENIGEAVGSDKMAMKGVLQQGKGMAQQATAEVREHVEKLADKDAPKRDRSV